MMTAAHCEPAHTVCMCCGLSGSGAIKCYNCDNRKSNACGQNFKSYQYEATPCEEDTKKCGKQTQLPNADGWVGVIRSCYPFGTVRGINESNGCHIYYNEDVNFTAEYCFCDRDYCNAGYGAVFRPSTDPRSRLLTLVALVLAFLLPSVLTRPTSSSCSCALAKIAQHAFIKRTGSRTYQKEVTAAVTLSGAGGTAPLHTCVHVASTGVHEGGNPLAAPERMWRKGQSLRREHHTLLGFDGETLSQGDTIVCSGLFPFTSLCRG
ncbi:hypothetical protein C0Q70_05345 [Pomacea canaliculata]|uniref:Protein sleepless n=1 Tax=Pomacea canaliculata TaxID=400727 RepID=A0A2T7PKX3_POMCA|nr:hypothetical protein C0Q70_05345 [Pomacea canaliculata]